MPETPDPDPTRTRKAWFFNGFRDRYCLGFVRKHFHAVRMTRESAPIPNDARPIIVVMNHPSWWDPMIACVLTREFGDREHYGAIEQSMLEKYGFFKWLGLVGVESDSLRGAAKFLRVAMKLLEGTSRVFWITSQGRFADVRERPLGLQSGVGHLFARLQNAWVVPIAIEYPFWTEKLPEVLIHIGPAIEKTDPGIRPSAWTTRFETALTAAADRLRDAAITQNPNQFRILLGGRDGVGGMYGFWQRLKSWARFRQYQPEHLESATSQSR